MGRRRCVRQQKAGPVKHARRGAERFHGGEEEGAGHRVIGFGNVKEGGHSRRTFQHQGIVGQESGEDRGFDATTREES